MTMSGERLREMLRRLHSQEFTITIEGILKRLAMLSIKLVIDIDNIVVKDCKLLFDDITVGNEES